MTKVLKTLLSVFLKLSWIFSIIFVLETTHVNAQLECSFGNYISYLNHEHNWTPDFSCLIEEQTIVDPVKTSQVSTVQNPKTNRDVKSVYFKSSTMNHFPDVFFAVFPNLVSVRFEYLTLNTLTADFFKEGRNLKYIHCNANLLTKLGPNLFVNSPNVEQISFERNPIETVHKNTFKGVGLLKILYLCNTKIKRLELGFFQDTISMNTLLLYDNQVEALEPNLFLQCKELEKLYAARNNIRTINRNTFNGLENLKEIYMSYNLLTHLESGTFEELKNLKKIWLSHNQIQSVAKDAFSGAISLNHLDLQSNKISELHSKTFQGLSKLNDLQLLNNTCINKSFYFPLMTLEESIRSSCTQNRVVLADTRTISQARVLEGCVIPDIANGKVADTMDQSIQTVGSTYTDWYYLSVVCDSKFFLVYDAKDKKEVICINNQWDKPFPTCRKLCSFSDISGVSIRPHCTRNGGTVPCDSDLFPGTQASIYCKTGYKPPDRYVSKHFVCLNSGNWDHEKYACEPICGVVTPQATPFIFGGTDTNIIEVPWHVGIYKDNSQICGGSILSEKIIISAAHCYYSEESRTTFSASHFKVAAGKYYRALQAVEKLRHQVSDVQRIIIEDDYRGYSGFYTADIAMLILFQQFTYEPHISPVCLEFYKYASEKYPSNGSEAFVAGWGLTKNDGRLSDTLQKVRMPTVDLLTCKERAPEEYKSFVNFDKICAGFADGTGACQGDSGGSLSISQTLGGKSIYFLHGIVSNGKTTTEGCDLGFFTVFTNVQEYASLIKNALRDYPSV